MKILKKRVGQKNKLAKSKREKRGKFKDKVRRTTAVNKNAIVDKQTDVVEHAVTNMSPEGKAATKKTKVKSKKSRRVFLGNLNMAPRLLIGFLIIAFLGAVIGVISIGNLDDINESSKRLYREILLPKKIIADISDDFREGSVKLRQSLLAEDANQQFIYMSFFKNQDGKNEGNISILEDLLPKDKLEELELLKDAFDQYDPILNEAIVLIDEGESEQVLNDLTSMGDLYSAESNVTKVIDALSFSITKDASSIATTNEKTANNARTSTIILVVAVVTLSILIGVVIARGVSKPIKRLTKNVQLLAAGRTDISLDDTDTRDEVGRMRSAVKTILQVIKDLDHDTQMLISASNEGELSVRADAEKHQGAYRRIVEGFNATLDAMIDPITESATVLRELSNGNLSVSVDGDFKGDFSIIKNTLNSTIETLKSYIKEISFVLDKISHGELDNTIESDFKGDFIALKDALNESILSFNRVIGDIDVAAEEVALGTAQVSTNSQTISQGATEQSSALEELTATLSEISDQTKHNAQSADSANEVSQKAMEEASVGNDKMKDLQTAMKEINVSSANISKIIKVIDDIAFQTNILSLNAAVEAARAGTHGKGFAVVAEEVRNLAARSAEAAKETTEIIERSLGKTKAGTQIADETAAALQSIVSGSEETVKLSGQIAIASNDQAVGINQVNSGIAQMSEVVQSNSATSQEMAASSEQLSAQAAKLKEMVSQFKLRANK